VSDYSEFNWSEFDLPSPVLRIREPDQDRFAPAFFGALEDLKPDAVVVYGDLDVTLAGTVVASRLGIPIIHIESGFRSGDLTDSEERNRIIIDR
jgi:hypothetical protein